jgi:hypothetical protein
LNILSHYKDQKLQLLIFVVRQNLQYNLYIPSRLTFKGMESLLQFIIKDF